MLRRRIRRSTCSFKRAIIGLPAPGRNFTRRSATRSRGCARVRTSELCDDCETKKSQSWQRPRMARSDCGVCCRALRGRGIWSEVVSHVLSSRHSRRVVARSQAFNFSSDDPKWTTARVPALSTRECDEPAARSFHQRRWRMESVLCRHRSAHCGNWSYCCGGRCEGLFGQVCESAESDL